jgi:hypothetical protein
VYLVLSPSLDWQLLCVVVYKAVRLSVQSLRGLMLLLRTGDELPTNPPLSRAKR